MIGKALAAICIPNLFVILLLASEFIVNKIEENHPGALDGLYEMFGFERTDEEEFED